MPLHPSDLKKGPLRWLLDLEWAGQTVRLCDGVKSARFEGYEYLPGLQFSGRLPDRINLFTRTPAAKTAAMKLHLGPKIDVPARVEAGHPLSLATARLWRWIEGTTTRELAMEGQVDDPVYGAPDGDEDLVELTLEEAVWEDRGKLPEATARVDSVTWPSADPEKVNEYYMHVFGHPGNGTTAYGSPALYVDTGAVDKLLIAGHEVAATSVEVLDKDDLSSGTFAVQHMNDGLGRRIAYVDMGAPTAGGPLTRFNGHAYFVTWTGGGGIKGNDGQELRGAGDVLRWFLEQTTLRWDRGRVAAAAPLLNGYKIDCYFMSNPEARDRPWDWISRSLLPLIPVSLRFGPEGLYPVVWRPDADKTEALDRLENGRNVRRVSPIAEQGRNDVANEFRLAYAFRAQDNKTGVLTVLTGHQPTLDAESAAIPSGMCKRSVARFGHRVHESDTRIVYDRTTALLILKWWARSRAFPTRLVEYRGAARDLGYLEPGNVIRLTDDDLHIDDRVGLVDEVLLDGSGYVSLILRLYEQVGPLRS